MSDHISLSAEDLLSRSLQEVERQQYFKRLDLKQRADIKIAEEYLLQVYVAVQRGLPARQAMDERKWQFLSRTINAHTGYFGGIQMLDQLGL